jgi:hypothetical protein
MVGAGLVSGGGRVPFLAQLPKVHRIGYLGPDLARQHSRALKDRLRELGYIEGRGFTGGPRDSRRRSERYAESAAELVGSHPTMALSACQLSAA